MQQLDPRYVRLERVVGYVTAVIVTVAGFGILAAVKASTDISFGVFCAVAVPLAVAIGAYCWLAHRWPDYAYRHAAYELGADAIEIRGGVLWRHVIRVPRSRVQHTDVAQGPLQRRYGLATLVLHTAGTKHARVELAGLAHETALALRDRLLPREHADAV